MSSRRQFIAAQIAAGEEWKRMTNGAQPFRAQDHSTAMAAAQERIRKLRMRAAEIDLGTPGAPVRVEQKRHAFPFGGQLWTIDADYRHGRWESPEARARRDRHTRLYNATNALCYWTERPQYDITLPNGAIARHTI
jgi:hypothetical protein